MNDKTSAVDNSKKQKIATKSTTDNKKVKTGNFSYEDKFLVYHDSDYKIFVLQCHSGLHATNVTQKLFKLQNTIVSQTHRSYVIVYTSTGYSGFNQQVQSFLKDHAYGMVELVKLHNLYKKQIDVRIEFLINQQNAVRANINNNNNSNASPSTTQKNSRSSSPTLFQQQPDQNTNQNSKSDEVIQASTPIDNLQILLLSLSERIQNIFGYIDIAIRSQNKVALLNLAKTSLVELNNKVLPYGVNPLIEKANTFSLEAGSANTSDNSISISIESIHQKCEILRQLICFIFKPDKQDEEKNKVIQNISQIIQWLYDAIIQLSIKTTQETPESLKEKNYSTANYFQNISQKKIQQKPQNDLIYTTQIIHDLLKYFIPDPSIRIHLTVLSLNQVYIRQFISDGIKFALENRTMTFIPIQESAPANETVNYFTGSLIVIKPQNNFIEIKYINPLGSCIYNHLHLNAETNANSKPNHLVFTKYMHIERNYILENIQNGILTNAASNPGILLTSYAKKFFEVITNDWLITLPKYKINLVFTGLVQIKDELQNCGAYLICNVFQEAHNKPLSSAWDIDKVKDLHYHELASIAESQESQDMNIQQTPIILD